MMAKSEIQFTSDLITLRVINTEDITDSYVRWLNDPEVNQFLEVRHAPQTLESVRHFVAGCYQSDTDWLFGIYYDGSHIGNVRIASYDAQQQRASLGLLIGSSAHRGKGIGTQVVRMASHWAMDNLKLEHLCAGCYANNTASIKIFEKCGYVVEGRFRSYWQLSETERVDHIALGLIKNDLC